MEKLAERLKVKEQERQDTIHAPVANPETACLGTVESCFCSYSSG